MDLLQELGKKRLTKKGKNHPLSPLHSALVLAQASLAPGSWIQSPAPIQLNPPGGPVVPASGSPDWPSGRASGRLRQSSSENICAGSTSARRLKKIVRHHNSMGGFSKRRSQILHKTSSGLHLRHFPDPKEKSIILYFLRLTARLLTASRAIMHFLLLQLWRSYCQKGHINRQ